VEHNEILHFVLRTPFRMTMKQQCNATRFLISCCAPIWNDNEKQRKALSSRTNVRDLNVEATKAMNSVEQQTHPKNLRNLCNLWTQKRG